MEKSNWNTIRKQFPRKGLSRATLLIWMCDLLLIGFSLFLFQLKGVYIILSWFFLTIALLHTYLFQHEATHNALSKSSTVNDSLGHFFSWLIFMPYLSRKRSHVLHHRYTGHPTLDPANKRAIEFFSVLSDDMSRKLELIWKYWIPLFVLNDRVGLWRDPFQNTHKNHDSLSLKKERNYSIFYILLYLLALIVLFRTSLLVTVLFWYLPALIFLFYLEELVNLPHHAETPLLGKEEKPLHFSRQYLVSHSCKHVPIWSNIFLLNFNRHIPHHLFPWVPWDQLPRLEDKIRMNIAPYIIEEKTRNEIKWSITNRKRSILDIMGHYFDKR
ncbi:fatty acid desaturase [Gilvimarinus agarilyticus]|uniref:fatty acid desaturase family protein n=1 Tax=Gilvimarinus sp. 2_MG-2023 TaxID=3062666 RepID=UPI001C0A1D6F|nr:fatty acid desaturase [Gilvimarinus sp. 2_MG-2023]MBU2884278.1 fatty acid desaturase [Gilvimarinus agarilyticus]MDO6569416.1 fatty acid desaturase [Gilvimarinus sp. 2_MG-2023]